MATPEPVIVPADLASDQPTSSARQRSLSQSFPSLSAAPLSPPPPLPSRRWTMSGGGSSGLRAKFGLAKVARRTLGITLLLVTVFLWTLSNFLASYIFSDHTYDKPFFLVYINTSIFAFSLIPMVARYVSRHGVSGLLNRSVELWREYRHGVSSPKLYQQVIGEDDEDEDGMSGQRLLVDDEDSVAEALDASPSRRGKTREGDDGKVGGGAGGKLGLGETAWLSLEFCMLWFSANYFASACLEYTSVGSVTILTSTSSVWTLVFCAAVRVERFSMRKLVGVLASLAGVVLISSVDLSGASDDNRGSFPHKTTAQIAIGDAMAFFSAIIYGVYVTVMKRRIGNEDRVDMQLFFGLVGLLNVLLLWPGFFLLHWTGIEPFSLPPTGKIWCIIMLNSVSSFVSDIAWAFAMLLTTPLVVTVGLSLTIPLSLIGEMIQYAQYSSWVYWVGAAVVFISFLFINHESKDEEGATETDPRAAAVVTSA